VAPPQPAPSPQRPPRAPDPVPLSPRRYKLAVTLDQQTHDQLRQLQGLLAHQIPDGDPAAIVKRALQALLAETQKKKTARTQKPRTPSMPRGTSSRTSRAVPADLKRAVWQRDQGRCGFISKDGHRCGATRALEYAHLHPWAKGGEHTLDNLCLRCRAHNAYEANRDYGERFMHSKRREGDRGLRVREVAVPSWGAEPRLRSRGAATAALARGWPAEGCSFCAWRGRRMENLCWCSAIVRTTRKDGSGLQALRTKRTALPG
jgi:5-methylcytosine-specific restriction endonuclease McrA